MRWPRQVGHVAAKDARHALLLLAGYIALSAVATAGIVSGQAFGPYWVSQTTEVLGMRDILVTWLPLTTVILGLISTVFFVQADSPTRAHCRVVRVTSSVGLPPLFLTLRDRKATGSFALVLTLTAAKPAAEHRSELHVQFVPAPAPTPA